LWLIDWLIDWLIIDFTNINQWRKFAPPNSPQKSYSGGGILPFGALCNWNIPFSVHYVDTHVRTKIVLWNFHWKNRLIPQFWVPIGPSPRTAGSVLRLWHIYVQCISHCSYCVNMIYFIHLAYTWFCVQFTELVLTRTLLLLIECIHFVRSLYTCSWLEIKWFPLPAFMSI